MWIDLRLCVRPSWLSLTCFSFVSRPGATESGLLLFSAGATRNILRARAPGRTLLSDARAPPSFVYLAHGALLLFRPFLSQLCRQRLSAPPMPPFGVLASASAPPGVRGRPRDAGCRAEGGAFVPGILAVHPFRPKVTPLELVLETRNGAVVMEAEVLRPHRLAI